MPRRSDRGSVTVFVAAAGLALTLVALTVASTATFLISRAQARNAADLAALAGAAWARAGQDVACSRASELAAENHAVLASCLLDGLDISVTVEVKGIRAVAFAGPVRTPAGDHDAG